KFNRKSQGRFAKLSSTSFKTLSFNIISSYKKRGHLSPQSFTQILGFANIQIYFEIKYIINKIFCNRSSNYYAFLHRLSQIFSCFLIEKTIDLNIPSPSLSDCFVL